jgi:di/tricarboxylate transporter
VLLAALMMVFTRCVSMKNAYASITWESLVLIAGMLSMATALEKTGGIQLIVNGLVASLDVVKIGIPLQLPVMVLVLLAVPMLFPLS